MKLLLSNQCILTAASLAIRDQLKTALTMKNPAYAEARKHGRWTGKIPKVLKFYEEGEHGSLLFPRGFLRGALDITGRDIIFEDRRRTLPEIDLQFAGVLRPYQQQAVEAILRKDFGVLEAATGSGKTVVALAVIAARRQPTLIAVHNKLLLYQWWDRVAKFLGIEAGLMGDGKYNLQPVTVAIVNTAKKHLDDLPGYFGQIVFDETHKIPAMMSSKVVRAFDCKYMLGLSATPYRRDRLTKLIHWFIGPLVHRIDPKELENLGAVLVPEIIFKQTDFYYKFRDDYAKMLSTLTQDETRNTQITNDVLLEVGHHGGTILIVSDRVKHCEVLANLLLSGGPNLNVRILTGQMKSGERVSLVEDIRAGKVDVAVATLQLVGEGLDIEGLSSLFFATPIRFSGRLIQVIGRILRPADGKKPRVHDYQDPVGPLFASAKAREKTYRSMGWK